LYEKLIKNEDKIAENDIEKDLQRTFPDLGLFMEPISSGKNLLYNVLKAYSQYDLQVGYCQGKL